MPPEPPSPRTYRWPWVLMAAVIVAVVAAVLWMKSEIQKTRRIRDASSPTLTNSPGNP